MTAPDSPRATTRRELLVSRGSREPRRVSERVVVFHRQLGWLRRSHFGFELTFFQDCAESGRRGADFGVGSQSGLDGAFRRHGRRGHCVSQLPNDSRGARSVLRAPTRIRFTFGSRIGMSKALAEPATPSSRSRRVTEKQRSRCGWTPPNRRSRKATTGSTRKGPEPGNASYYYSFPRLTARDPWSSTGL